MTGDEALSARLAVLNAMPWRGACPCCQFSLWCADTEEDAQSLVAKHIEEEHVIRPVTWRDH